MTLGRRIGAVTLLSFAASLAALAKNAAIAARFGVSGDADLIAYGEAVLQFLPTILLLRECVALFVSVYGRLLAEDGTAGANALYAGGLKVVLGIGIMLSLIVLLLPAPLMRLIAPGLSPEQVARGAQLLRWISPALLLQEVAEFTRTVHNAHHRYAIPGLVTLVGNLLQTFLLVAFEPARAMAAWIIALNGAALIQASILIALVPEFRLRDLCSIEPLHPELRRLLRLVSPIAAGVVLVQLAGYIERAVLSYMPTGSIATLAYSRKLVGPIQTVLAGSIALPIYVQMSRLRRGESADRVTTFWRGFEINLFLFVPITVMIFFLAPQIVELAFRRGLFGAAEVAATVPLLRIGALALLPASMLLLLRDFCYATAGTRPLVVGGVVQLLTTGVANLLLAREYGLVWIPIGVVAGIWLTCVSLLLILRVRLAMAGWGGIVRGGVIALVSSAAAAAAIHFVLAFVSTEGASASLRALGLAGVTGLMVFGGVALSLGHPLMRAAMRNLRAHRS